MTFLKVFVFVTSIVLLKNAVNSKADKFFTAIVLAFAAYILME